MKKEKTFKSFLNIKSIRIIKDAEKGRMTSWASKHSVTRQLQSISGRLIPNDDDVCMDLLICLFDLNDLPGIVQAIKTKLITHTGIVEQIAEAENMMVRRQIVRYYVINESIVV